MEFPAQSDKRDKKNKISLVAFIGLIIITLGIIFGSNLIKTGTRPFSKAAGETNLALSKLTTASGNSGTDISAKAVNGILTDGWNSGYWSGRDRGNQWIQIDLGSEQTITNLKLYVFFSHPDFPNGGQTIHEIETAGNSQVFQKIDTVSGITKDGDILNRTYNPPKTNVRYVKVTTTQSASWVAWREIEIYAPQTLASPTPTRSASPTLTIAPTSPTPTIPASSVPAVPVAIYPLNELSGNTVANSLTANNPGTAVNTAIVTGQTGKARSFNGTNSYISIPYSTIFNFTNSISMEAWVKLNNLPPAGKYASIINKWISGQEDKHLAVFSDGKVAVYLHPLKKPDNSPAVAYSLKTLSPGRWHHVAATYNAAEIKIYIDGVLSSTTPASGTIANSSVQSTLFIGGNPPRMATTDPMAYLNGIIDNVRISTGVSTPNQIYSNSSLGKTCSILLERNFTTPNNPVVVSYRGTTNGNNEKVSIWMSRQPNSVSGGERITPLETLPLMQEMKVAPGSIPNWPWTKDFYQYYAQGCVTGGGRTCTGIFEIKNLPEGQYNVFCGIGTVPPSCSGQPFCNYYQGPAPASICTENGWKPCGINDHTTFTVTQTIPTPTPRTPYFRPVLEFKMDETSGSAVLDSSWRRNNGTAYNTTIIDGKKSKARQFSKSQYSIITGNDWPLPFGNTPLTVAMWVKTTATFPCTTWSLSCYGVLFHYGTIDFLYPNDSERSNGRSFAVGIGTDNNSLNNSIYSGFWSDSVGANTVVVNDGNWHHVVTTWDGTTDKLYVDGVLKNQKALRQPVNVIRSRQYRIGSTLLNTSYFDGAIDEFAVYNRVLTDTEIRNLFAN